jgi:FKBP-type peptidyl-prolyl cis-trans isomerase FklB
MRIRSMAVLGLIVLGACSKTEQASTPEPAKEPAATASTTKDAAAPATTAGGTSMTAAILTLNSTVDKVNYTLARNLVMNLKEQGVEINRQALLRGIEDAVSDATPLCSEEEGRAAMTELRTELMTAQKAKDDAVAAENKKAGDAFLAENKTKEGVVTLPSGLQYKVIKEGTGKTPTAESTVVTNYRGTLIDGTEFDSSYSRNQPATFGASQVIKGWTEALLLMKEGAKWQLFIPADSRLRSAAPWPQDRSQFDASVRSRASGSEVAGRGRGDAPLYS